MKTDLRWIAGSLDSDSEASERASPWIRSESPCKRIRLKRVWLFVCRYSYLSLVGRFLMAILQFTGLLLLSACRDRAVFAKDFWLPKLPFLRHLHDSTLTHGQRALE